MAGENPRRGRGRRKKGEEGEEIERAREEGKTREEEIRESLIRDVGEEVLRELVPLLELSDEEIRDVLEVVSSIPERLRNAFIRLLDEVSDEEIEEILESGERERIWELMRAIPGELREEFITLVKKTAKGEELTEREQELLTDYPAEAHLLGEWWRTLSERWRVELKDVLKVLLMDYSSQARLLVEWRKRELKDVLKTLLSLRDIQLSTLYGALLKEPSVLRKAIESVKPAPPAPAPKPPEKPVRREKPPPKPPKLPKRPWRSVWPFKTATFIRSYLKLKGEATPYEVYRAFVHTITLIIKDERFREEIEKKRGIRVDGTIDEDIVVKEYLATGAAEHYKKRMIELGIPLYHKTSYTSFWRYFYILERLGLIERVGKREWRKGFFRQRYKIVEGQEDSELWEYPQSVLYPLSFLGRQRYKRVFREAAEKFCKAEGIEPEELGISPKEAFKTYATEKERHSWIVRVLPELYGGAVGVLARRRGVSEEELLRIIEEQDYIPKEKIEESMRRVREIGEEKARSLGREKE